MEQLRYFFGWCALFNYALLIIWFVICVTGRGIFMGVCRRLFHISEETYDSGMFYGISFYKLAILLFTVIPYLTLRVLK